MNNTIAGLLRAISIIILILSIISFIAGLVNLGENLVFLITGIGGAVSAVFVRGFAEVIELLEEIKNNSRVVPVVQVNAAEKAEEIEDDELPDI